MSKEAIVGLLVSFACLLMLGLSPGKERRAPILGDTYNLVFHYVRGLRVGDTVVIGGVEAGKIASIDFAPRDQWGNGQPVVIVKIAVQNSIALPEKTEYKVISNLRGQRMINIIPGAPGPPIPRGGTLTEERPSQDDDQLQSTIRTFKMLSKRTEDMRRQFASAEFRRDTKDMASNMRFYSREFLAASGKVPEQLNGFETQLNRQEASLKATLARVDAQVDRASARMHQIGPALHRNLAAYDAQFAGVQKQINGFVAMTNGYTKQLQGMNAAFDARVTSKINVEQISRQVHEIAQKLDDYAALSGDIHAVSSDKQVQADLKARITKFKALSEQLKATMQKYQDMVEHLPVNF